MCRTHPAGPAACPDYATRAEHLTSREMVLCASPPTLQSEPIRATRMLAIMICPAPERHEAVVKHCVNPLLGEYVSNLTKQRLEAALPDTWLS
ncbi:hypothetical protein [Amycolatopsis alba]|uniref:hypothetical protein n=1 Tax=Amycolatopsis alba TaxID=76020 RepID=UPI00035F4C1F|nr:hypothetical protein [Amycolatopsis alba]